MRLRNQLILLIIAICLIALACILIFGNQPDLSSPSGHSLDTLLVRTQSVVYHDEDALYGEHFAARIDDPETINAVIKLLGQTNCAQKPLAADENITTTATHRLLFSGSGVAIYLDTNQQAAWYEYGNEVPARQRYGYSDDLQQANTALVYMIKDQDKLAELIALLDTSAVGGMQVEYTYSLLTADGNRGEFTLVEADAASDGVNASPSSKDSLMLSLGSRQQARFVLRDKMLNGDEISLAALQPREGGLRPMSSIINYDYEKAGKNDIRVDLAWNEQAQPTRYAIFQIMVVDEAFIAAAEQLQGNFTEESIKAYLPYLGISAATIDVKMNFALIDDGAIYYYLLQNGDLRPITKVHEAAAYEAVSNDYFVVTGVKLGDNGYRGFLSKYAYTYAGGSFAEVVLSDYQALSVDTTTGYDIAATLSSIDFNANGLQLTFAGSGNDDNNKLFPYIEAHFDTNWNTGELRLKNTVLGESIEPYAYSEDSRISDYYAEQDGEDVLLKISVGSWRDDYYHIQENADGTVVIKLNESDAIDANLNNAEAL